MTKGRVLTRNRPKILNINTLPDRIQIRSTYANVSIHNGSYGKEENAENNSEGYKCPSGGTPNVFYFEEILFR